MNKKKNKSKGKNNLASDEMRAEYDFSGGVRGKHHQAYRQGHTVRIHQADGNVIEPQIVYSDLRFPEK
jgi:hypothetical protein